MGEKADSGSYERFAYDADVGFGGGISEESRVLNWEDGLPGGEDLSPLSLLLVPPELAFAFSIPPADFKTNLDVNRATQKTISSLKLRLSPSLLGIPKLLGVGASTGDDCPMFLEAEEPEDLTLLDTPRTVERLLEHGYKESVDSSTLLGEKSVDDQRALKRPRLAWTPQLHKRFVDVVTHLGIRNVVPKTIMELMNVEGLTRENVASHLQKYRIYVKRMQGHSNELSSDHIFASTTVPQNLPEQQQQQQLPKLVQVPYTMPTAIPVPIYSIPHHFSQGMVPLNNYQGVAGYNGLDSHHSYGLNNWSGASMFGSIISYPHVSYNDNRSSETEKKKPNDK